MDDSFNGLILISGVATRRREKGSKGSSMRAVSNSFGIRGDDTRAHEQYDTHMHSGFLARAIIVHVALAMASYDGHGRPSGALVLSTSMPNAASAITSCVKRPANGRRSESRKKGGEGRA